MHKRQAENLALEAIRLGVDARPIRVVDKGDAGEYGYGVQCGGVTYRTAAQWNEFVRTLDPDEEQRLDEVLTGVEDVLGTVDYSAEDRHRMARFLYGTRTRFGMSQEEMGDALGVTSNTIARWERGELMIQHPKLLRLALTALIHRWEPEEEETPDGSAEKPPTIE